MHINPANTDYFSDGGNAVLKDSESASLLIIFHIEVLDGKQTQKSLAQFYQ